MTVRNLRATRKRCTRCGNVSTTRERICGVPRFGKGSYVCAGKLEPAPLRPRKPKTKPAAIEATTRELAAALAQLAAWHTRAKRAKTAIKKLKKRVRYYQRRQDAIAAREAAARAAAQAGPITRAYFDESEKPL